MCRCAHHFFIDTKTVDGQIYENEKNFTYFTRPKRSLLGRNAFTPRIMLNAFQALILMIQARLPSSLSLRHLIGFSKMEQNFAVIFEWISFSSDCLHYRSFLRSSRAIWTYRTERTTWKSWY